MYILLNILYIATFLNSMSNVNIATFHSYDIQTLSWIVTLQQNFPLFHLQNTKNIFVHLWYNFTRNSFYGTRQHVFDKLGQIFTFPIDFINSVTISMGLLSSAVCYHLEEEVSQLLKLHLQARKLLVEAVLISFLLKGALSCVTRLRL